MSVSAADIARLRRMIAEPTSTTYTDSVLSEMIERYPVHDEAGNAPNSAQWTPTYDLNAAAGDVWSEKAAALSTMFDFSADGGSYQRSQATVQAMRMAQFYRSRRFAKGKCC